MFGDLGGIQAAFFIILSFVTIFSDITVSSILTKYLYKQESQALYHKKGEEDKEFEGEH